ncbi:MAG: sulfate adenylyltransferase [Sulfobacillus acidophilus]|uniref:sulfate adenylyltransferase n=1 Tax=Sulfobacillus acidophilus TaxID=53633 RepID=A0A2T2WMY6_9FIRM|nr:MAG: sulfate adenylyltransferase [Sulfobacillus acidophilus]
MRTPSLIAPHGGYLAEQELPVAIAQELRHAFDHLPAIPIDRFQLDDAICLAWGVFSPLRGFQNRHEVQSVLKNMHLPSGAIWPIPITLPISGAISARIKKSRLVRLVHAGQTRALLHVDDIFWQDPEEEAAIIYGTRDPHHPGVAHALTMSPIRLAGPVTLTQEPQWPQSPVLTPRAMRTLIRERGWSTVAAFQTRNPLHRAHEYVQKVVLEQVDGLVIHPLIGTTKRDDVPVAVRWHIYETLLKEYYPLHRTGLSGFPAAMRYAGPREAVLHALARKNYGFSHFIIGRDHAGVGTYYHPQASQQIFDQFDPAELGITIIASEPAFYCRKCEQMATKNTCPHQETDHEALSGTRVRATLEQGGSLPPTVIRPEVEAILAAYYQQRLSDSMDR